MIDITNKRGCFLMFSLFFYCCCFAVALNRSIVAVISKFRSSTQRIKGKKSLFDPMGVTASVFSLKFRMHIMRAMWISYKDKFNPNRDGF